MTWVGKWAWACAMVFGTTLGGQEIPFSDSHLAVGAYQLNLTNGFGPWRGFLVDGSWDPFKNGKFIGAITGYDRPEGDGTVFSVGKYQNFKGGFGFLGLITSKGASYLPEAQVTADLNFDLPWTGWVLGGGAIYNRVRDGHRNSSFLLGPTYYWGNTVTTLRGSMDRSDPGALTSFGGQVRFRHGLNDQKSWQAFRVIWGAEAYESFLVQAAVRSHGFSCGLDTSWPLGHGFSVQAGVEFARKNNAYDLWGGNLKLVKYF